MAESLRILQVISNALSALALTVAVLAGVRGPAQTPEATRSSDEKAENPPATCHSLPETRFIHGDLVTTVTGTGCGPYFEDQASDEKREAAPGLGARRLKALPPSDKAKIARDPTSPLRVDAIKALGESESAEAHEALGEILRSDPDAKVRSASALSLGRHGDAAGIKALAQTLATDTSTTVRVSAARSLGMIGKPAAEEPLMTAGRLQPPVEVRAAVVLALGSFHTETSYQLLTDSLRDPAAQVKLSALESLARRGETKASPLVLTLVEDRDPAVVERACWTLGELRDRAATPRLKQALLQGTTVGIRREGALALGRIGDPEALDALRVSALRDSEDLSVRLAAIKALPMLSTRAGARPLLRLVGHRESILRSAAAYSLVQLRTQESILPLTRLLDDPDRRVQRNAVITLGLWPQAFAGPLLKVVADKAQDVEVRMLALTALSDVSPEILGGEEAVRSLLSMLDPNEPLEVQVAGVRLLGTIGTPAAGVALRQFGMKEGLDPEVRLLLERFQAVSPNK